MSPKYLGPLTYVQTIWLRATKFSTVRHSGQERVSLGVNHAPGRAPASSGFLWPSTCAHTVWETTTNFCTAIKLDVRKCLHGRPRMLTRDLFAVGNLLVLCRPVNRQNFHNAVLSLLKLDLHWKRAQLRLATFQSCDISEFIGGYAGTLQILADICRRHLSWQKSPTKIFVGDLSVKILQGARARRMGNADLRNS